MRSLASSSFVLVAICLVVISCQPADPPADQAASSEPSNGLAPTQLEPSWMLLESGTDASLRGLHAADAQNVWASGSGGTFLLSADGGTSWSIGQVEGAEELDFRDVQVFDAQHALLMSAGQPARVYRTDDAGDSWTMTHESEHPAAFFDSFAFWHDATSEDRGLMYSDPVDGRFLILLTDDGGVSWREVPASALPAPVDGEAGFAASGTMVTVGEGGRAWIGTGGEAARVLKTADYGQTWTVAPTPLDQQQPTAGIFSLAFSDAENGLAVGGTFEAPDSTKANFARTTDGGITWQTVDEPPTGYRSCVLPLPNRPGTWLAVGRSGTDLSIDDGQTWRRVSDQGFYTASAVGDIVVAAGADGRLGKLDW